ncbi:MAG TPA: hypothetical protein DCR61_09220, partial [Verrucomicrobiales bacterium]|nr:hypothetical protein [Verrucomicrobiales bacterium]
MCGGSLDSIIDSIDPDISKWASLVIAHNTEGQTEFDWHYYRNSRETVDFWPASTIKIYTVVAALEYLNELKRPLDSTLVFERQTDDLWHLDTARTMRE